MDTYSKGESATANVLRRCEAEFRVSLEDGGAPFDSVGALYAHLLRRLRAGKLLGCPLLKEFLRLRTALAAHTRLDRRWIGPRTRLEYLFPIRGRRRRWQELAREAELPLPMLRSICPDGLAALVAVLVGLPAAFMVSMFLGNVLDTAFALDEDVVAVGVALLGVLLVFGVPSAIFLWIKHRTPAIFPNSVSTVGDVAGYLARERLLSAVVWRKLEHIVSTEMQVPVEEVSPALPLGGASPAELGKPPRTAGR